jgi:hypothetical protein
MKGIALSITISDTAVLQRLFCNKYLHRVTSFVAISYLQKNNQMKLSLFYLRQSLHLTVCQLIDIF